MISMSYDSSAEFPLGEVISYPTIFITFGGILYLLLRYNHPQWLLCIIISVLAVQILLHPNNHYNMLLIWSATVFLDMKLLITIWKVLNLAPLCSPIRVGLIIRKHILEVVRLLISTLNTIRKALDMYSDLALCPSFAVYGLITAVFSIIRHIFQGEPNTRTT